MKKLYWFALAALLGGAACDLDHSQDVTRLAPEPALTGGTYSTGGGLTLASTYRNVGGFTALCGLWSESQSQTPFSKGKARDVIASGSGYLKGQRIVTGLQYFQKTPAGTNYSGTDAPCRVSDLPWQPEYANLRPEIRLPEQIVYRARNRGNGGLNVIFKQTGPGALSGSLNLVQTLFRQAIRIDLGSSPVLSRGSYSSGGTIRVAADLRQIGPDAYVCGVWTQSRGQVRETEQQAPEVLARGKVLVNDTVIVEDFRFMRRVSRKGSMAGKSANCINSGVKWKDLGPTKRVSLRLPQLVIYADATRTITFSPTAPDA